MRSEALCVEHGGLGRQGRHMPDLHGIVGAKSLNLELAAIGTGTWGSSLL